VCGVGTERESLQPRSSERIGSRIDGRHDTAHAAGARSWGTIAAKCSTKRYIGGRTRGEWPDMGHAVLILIMLLGGGENMLSGKL